MNSLGLAAGAALDAVAADPSRWHPVAGFGTVAASLERTLYADSRPRGVAYAALLVGGAVGSGRLAGRLLPPPLALTAATFTTLGGTSLAREGRALSAALRRGDVEAARRRLPALCGRNPAGLDTAGLSRATVESVAENTSDAVVAPLLWGALAGVPGLLGYRALNTLDAMVGYRSARYARFGWAAARLDDAANWVPARVTAGLACLLAPLVGGSSRTAWSTLRRDGGAHPSPNAGRCEAAFAGALGVRLGGTNGYGSRTEERPHLGDGAGPGVGDIDRAVRLSRAVTVAATALAVGLARARGPAGRRLAPGRRPSLRRRPTLGRRPAPGRRG